MCIMELINQHSEYEYVVPKITIKLNEKHIENSSLNQSSLDIMALFIFGKNFVKTILKIKK